MSLWYSAAIHPEQLVNLMLTSFLVYLILLTASQHDNMLKKKKNLEVLSSPQYLEFLSHQIIFIDVLM